MAEIRTPQTAHPTSLHHEVGNHPSCGLTPSKLAQILDAAEQGEVAQYELFEDIEEKGRPRLCRDGQAPPGGVAARLADRPTG